MKIKPPFKEWAERIFFPATQKNKEFVTKK
jgi:hypothetical protein